MSEINEKNVSVSGATELIGSQMHEKYYLVSFV